MRKKYNNEEYRELVEEFLGEAFYLPGISYGTKIQKIRQYTEIILRRLLNYPCDKKIEIGNLSTKDKLNCYGYTEPLFENALETIRNTGNERSHTKLRHPAQKDEYDEIVDALFDLYGYLFYKYFKKYEFGSDNKILEAFSILPPIIRHIALNELYNDFPSNIYVIDKLVLSKMKAFGISEAIEWVKTKKEELEKLPCFDLATLKNTLTEIMGKAYAENMINSIPQNMYEACLTKIESSRQQIANSKPLYTDFETAKSYYLSNGIVTGTTEEINEFNDLMEFVYMGRKQNESQIASINDENYLIYRLK